MYFIDNQRLFLFRITAFWAIVKLVLKQNLSWTILLNSYVKEIHFYSIFLAKTFGFSMIIRTFAATELVCIPSELQASHFFYIITWIRNQEQYKNNWPDSKKKGWFLMMSELPLHIWQGLVISAWNTIGLICWIWALTILLAMQISIRL